jgi:hypothetical protein
LPFDEANLDMRQVMSYAKGYPMGDSAKAEIMREKNNTKAGK